LPRCELRSAEPAAGARIWWSGSPMRRAAGARDFGLNFAPRAKARIEHAHRRQVIESGAVVVEMFRLPADRAIPVEPEPCQILKDRRGELLLATGAIDILDAQEKPPAIV